MLKKGDFLLVILILAATVAAFAGIRYFKNDAGGHKIAVIKQDNKVIREIDLDRVEEPERITLTGKYNNKILVEKGRIRFEESDCPDLVCVHTGWLDERGSSAACLPNKVVVVIQGGNNEVDAGTY